MTGKLISIIITTYNHGRYIGDTLDSVLYQSADNWECIITDDGSTDNTREIAESYSSKSHKIKYYYQDNAGRSAGRNNGVRNSSGEYLMFLDSDDVLKKNHIEILFRAMEKENAGIVFTDTQRFTDNGNSYQFLDYKMPEVKEGLINGSDMYRALFENNVLTINSAMIRKDIFKRLGGFNTRYNQLEDYDFWLRAAGLGEDFFHIGEKIALYRMLPDTLTHNTERITITKYAELDILINNYNDQLIHGNILKRRMRSVHKRAIRKLIGRNDKKAAISNIKEYFQLYGKKSPGDLLRTVLFLFKALSAG